MARRSDHSKQQIKEMAISAARELIREQGLPALSARKIAKQIGYTPGTLYLVFKNLDELILHINAITLQQLYHQLQNATKRCTTPQQCILTLGQEYLNFATENKHLWRAIFDHNLPENEIAPEWFQAHITRLYQLVEKQLKQLDLKIDTHLAANALWSGVHGVCVLGFDFLNRQEQSESDIKVLVDSLISNYLKGLMHHGT